LKERKLPAVATSVYTIPVLVVRNGNGNGNGNADVKKGGESPLDHLGIIGTKQKF